MSDRMSRKWILKVPYTGPPKREYYDIVEEKLPALQDGEFLLEAQWISVDPYQRKFPFQTGGSMISSQVGKVIESKNSDYAIGDMVHSTFGWVTHAVCNGTQEGHMFGLRKIDTASSVSPSTALGILGMPGATAYFGLLNICDPKPGETLLVNAAAGAVGSAVGQIGKIKGMRVVGFAGSDEKVEYLKSIGFDAAYNYKKVSSLSDAIAEGCPNGVDVFFDSVGGDFFEAALTNMKSSGRVCVIGSISEYNLTETPSTQPITGIIVSKQLKIQGFAVIYTLAKWPVAFKEMEKWIAEGILKYNECVYDGFDNLFDAFNALFSGKNIGKIVVKIK